ncbi:unnamed protein product [Vitrella brassicaformis CCMP3155]|uniref:VPS9 domain-containing protein n=2 Tax=Vitrella brassicaformis TaxID=1169539 RepID=A0A0G4GSH7_VITBC|nr:unnamed protein product [Vitrella brassicaformis CCMP3155]|eukprot:CEM33556.1 unnamed protein product [Vitrella brassicaformis CCMP3155]
MMASPLTDNIPTPSSNRGSDHQPLSGLDLLEAPPPPPTAAPGSTFLNGYPSKDLIDYADSTQTHLSPPKRGYNNELQDAFRAASAAIAGAGAGGGGVGEATTTHTADGASDGVVNGLVNGDTHGHEAEDDSDTEITVAAASQVPRRGPPLPFPPPAGAHDEEEQPDGEGESESAAVAGHSSDVDKGVVADGPASEAPQAADKAPDSSGGAGGPQQQQQQGPGGVVGVKTGYSGFIELFKHPSAQGVVAAVREFVSGFPERLGRRQASEMLHHFLAETQEKLLQTEVFASSPAEVQQNAREGLEKFVLIKLHHRLFRCEASDEAEDKRLHDHLSRLQWLSFEHLDVPALPEEGLELAINELRKVEQYKSPRDKLVCILNTCMVITNVIQDANTHSSGRTTPPGADDFLPVLIYVLVKANPPNLHSNVEYVGAFRHPTRLASQDLYFFTHLSSALSFVKNIGTTSQLTISDDDFNRLYYAPIESPPVSEEEQPSAAEQPVGEPQPAPPSPEAAPPPAPPSPEAVADIIRRMDSLPRRFDRAREAKSLTLGEVPQLLSEYSELLDVVRAAMPVLEHYHRQQGGPPLALQRPAGGGGGVPSPPSEPPPSSSAKPISSGATNLASLFWRS